VAAAVINRLEARPVSESICLHALNGIDSRFLSSLRDLELLLRNVFAGLASVKIARLLTGSGFNI
jgi:hypothetical protein